MCYPHMKEGEKQMYCMNCGTKNDDQAKFCIKCGLQLTDSVVVNEKSKPAKSRF